MKRPEELLRIILFKFKCRCKKLFLFSVLRRLIASDVLEYDSIFDLNTIFYFGRQLQLRYIPGTGYVARIIREVAVTRSQYRIKR